MPERKISTLNAPANNENEMIAQPTLSISGTWPPCRSVTIGRSVLTAK
jgi:hypothetical protein